MPLLQYHMTKAHVVYEKQELGAVFSSSKFPDMSHKETQCKQVPD
jgi:hypothetical protein